MDDLTPAEAADGARRLLGQLEALAIWCAAHGLMDAHGDLCEAITHTSKARIAIRRLDRLDYTGNVVYQRMTPEELEKR